MRKIREIKDLRNFSATRYIVLSRASTHPRASVHPPISTVLWFFEVLHVTSHHAKFLCSESKVGPLSSRIDVIILMSFRPPQHLAATFCTHQSVASFAAFLTCSTETHILQATNNRRSLAMRQQVGPLLVHNTALASMKHGQSDNAGWFGAPRQLTSHLGWALAQLNHSSTSSMQLPTLFGAWAAIAHGRLLGIIRYVYTMYIYKSHPHQHCKISSLSLASVPGYLGKWTAGFSSNCVHTLSNSATDEAAPSVAR